MKFKQILNFHLDFYFIMIWFIAYYGEKERFIEQNEEKN
jgi:hypothetical protein